jgi:hypothetical protein
MALETQPKTTQPKTIRNSTFSSAKNTSTLSHLNFCPDTIWKNMILTSVSGRTLFNMRLNLQRQKHHSWSTRQRRLHQSRISVLSWGFNVSMICVTRFLVRCTQSKNTASLIMIGKLRTGINGRKRGLKRSSRETIKGRWIYFNEN